MVTELFKDKQSWNKLVLHYIHEMIKQVADNVGDLANFNPDKIDSKKLELLKVCPRCKNKTMQVSGWQDGLDCTNCNYTMPFGQVIKILGDKE